MNHQGHSEAEKKKQSTLQSAHVHVCVRRRRERKGGKRKWHFECDFEGKPSKIKQSFNQLEYRCVSLPVLGYVIFSDTRKAVQPLINLTSQDMVPSEAMLDNSPVILWQPFSDHKMKWPSKLLPWTQKWKLLIEDGRVTSTPWTVEWERNEVLFYWNFWILGLFVIPAFLQPNQKANLCPETFWLTSPHKASIYSLKTRQSCMSV